VVSETGGVITEATPYVVARDEAEAWVKALAQFGSAYAAAGRCDSFEEYRRVCGVVQGLNYAENIIEDLVLRMEKSDD
jgi:hypothetical protein